MSRTIWAWARPAGAAATIAVLVWRLGADPFVEGARTVDRRALVAGVCLTLLTTLCSAWRWRIVARGLGLDLPFPVAVAAYYRSQFLNVTLPGGVVGDVHRGVSHGRDSRDVGRGLRAVWWERSAGQVVQALITVAVLLALPSPVQRSMPAVAIAGAAAAVVIVLVVRARPGGQRSDRLWSTAIGDIRAGLLAGRAWFGVGLASVLAVAGYAAAFMVAARTAGTDAPVSQLLPLALLVMLAMVLPNIAGWGPREGVTAWAFGAAGLGASQGVATAVVFGVMMLVATLPGAAVLVVAWLRRSPVPAAPVPPLSRPVRVAVRSDGPADA